MKQGIPLTLSIIPTLKSGTKLLCIEGSTNKEARIVKGKTYIFKSKNDDPEMIDLEPDILGSMDGWYAHRFTLMPKKNIMRGESL